MKREVAIQPVFVQFIPEELEERKIYISEEYKTASHKCFCGCGKLVVTPFAGSGKVWGLIKHSDNKISIDGSIGNMNYECQSHYVIRENIAIID